MNYFDTLRQSRNAAIYAYIRSHLQPQNAGRSNGGGGSNVESEPTPPVPPTPSEPVEYEVKWDFIHDEESWNAAYNREGSPLKKYYDAHPEEDLWNTKEGRAVNFNDRHYVGTIDGEKISCGTLWADDGVQKITVDGVDYYFEIWGYTLEPKTVELFSDIALSKSTGKMFEISDVSFSEDCKQCWDGMIHAPDAKLPWAAVDLKSPYDLSKYEGKIEFQYDGNSYYPFGSEFGKFNGFGMASIPVELGVDPIDPNDQEATDTFDESKLTIKGYVKLS